MSLKDLLVIVATTTRPARPASTAPSRWPPSMGPTSRDCT
jgi:hypothetical protein